MRIFMLLPLLLLALAACSPLAIEEASMPTYTLEDAAGLLPALADMPSGFVVDQEATANASNADLAQAFVDSAAAAAFLDETGRLGGQYATWRNGSFAGAGNGLIITTALIFETAGGAQAYMDTAATRELERNAAPDRVVEVSAPDLGEASIAFAGYYGGDEPYMQQAVWARVDNALLVAEGRSFPDMGDLDQLVFVVDAMLAD